MANEFIERENAIQFVREIMTNIIAGNDKTSQVIQGYETAIEAATGFLRFVPTADVVEVRHGQWSYEYSGEKLGGTDATYDYLCSVCNKFAVEESNYCPNCGAKMDGKGTDNA